MNSRLLISTDKCKQANTLLEEFFSLKSGTLDLKVCSSFYNYVFISAANHETLSKYADNLEKIKLLLYAYDGRIITGLERSKLSPASVGDFYFYHSIEEIIVRLKNALLEKAPPIFSITDPDVRKEAAKLLKHVVDGEQAEAEKMLIANPKLLLCYEKEQATQHRHFNNAISPFQLALWALDKHMWEMMLRIPQGEDGRKLNIELLKQYNELMNNGIQYTEYTIRGYEVVPHQLKSKHYDLSTIIMILNIPEMNRDETLWLTAGQIQKKLPTHIAQRYCAIYIKPKDIFDFETNPRDLPGFYHEAKKEFIYWYIHPAERKGLGNDCAVMLATKHNVITAHGFAKGEAFSEAMDARDPIVDLDVINLNIKMLTELRDTRIRELHELKGILEARIQANPVSFGLQQVGYFPPPKQEPKPSVPQEPKNNKKDDEIPEYFTCTFTGEIMKEPVQCILDWKTYEKANIVEWFKTRNFAPGNRKVISAGQTVNDVLIPNKHLEEAIEDFKEKNQHLFLSMKPK